MALYASTYIATAFVMLVMDSVWLYVMAGRLYRPQIGALMRDGFDPVAAVLFYLVFVAGIVTFVGVPAWDSARWTTPLWRGALFGLVAYATYDLTNQATLRIWSTRVTILDLCWGAFASALAAVVSYAITAWASRAIS